MKIDIKLRRVQAVAAVIVILVGIFLLSGCFPNKVTVSILSVIRSYDQKIDQQGSGHSTSVPVNPTVDKKLEFSPTLDLMP